MGNTRLETRHSRSRSYIHRPGAPRKEEVSGSCSTKRWCSTLKALTSWDGLGWDQVGSKVMAFHLMFRTTRCVLSCYVSREIFRPLALAANTEWRSKKFQATIRSDCSSGAWGINSFPCCSSFWPRTFTTDRCWSKKICRKSSDPFKKLGFL